MNSARCGVLMACDGDGDVDLQGAVVDDKGVISYDPQAKRPQLNIFRMSLAQIEEYQSAVN